MEIIQPLGADFKIRGVLKTGNAKNMPTRAAKDLARDEID